MSAAADQIPAPPFHSTEAAWFWTMRALVARRHGQREERGPCEPEQVVAMLDRLYRQRRIDLEHVRILRIWGERGVVPAPRSNDRMLWDHVLSALDWQLRAKGVVA